MVAVERTWRDVAVADVAVREVPCKDCMVVAPADVMNGNRAMREVNGRDEGHRLA